MARKRLNIKKKTKEVTKSPYFYISIATLLLLGVAGLVYLFNLDPLVLIPRYYQNNEYNEITLEKNELIDKNSDLISQNDEIGSDVVSYNRDVEGYEKRLNGYENLIQNTEQIIKNLQDINELDETLITMRLPFEAKRYAELTYEHDQVRLDMMEKSLKITQSKYDMTQFNYLSAQFDSCIEKAKKNSNDSEVSKQIKNCLTHLNSMSELLTEMESEYDIELEHMNQYVTLMQGKWQASADYHAAIAEDDYETAVKHDDTFIAKNREIEELDPIEYLTEFEREVTEVLVEDFEELREIEREKEQKVIAWQDENL